VVIAHEMAHMWFGDLVTMRWWNDGWLSESFAEYMGFQVLAEAEVAASGGAEVARVLCRHGFPHHAVTAATLRAGERCLDSGGVTGSLRRLLADQLEDLRRSLTVRG
jgi:aminopeptidase N